MKKTVRFFALVIFALLSHTTQASVLNIALDPFNDNFEHFSFTFTHNTPSNSLTFDSSNSTFTGTYQNIPSITGIANLVISSSDYSITLLNANTAQLASPVTFTSPFGNSTFSDLTFTSGTIYNGSSITQSNNPASRKTLAFNTTVTTVPIPTAIWLMGSGLLGLIGFSQNKKTQTVAV